MHFSPSNCTHTRARTHSAPENSVQCLTDPNTQVACFSLHGFQAHQTGCSFLKLLLLILLIFPPRRWNLLCAQRGDEWSWWALWTPAIAGQRCRLQRQRRPTRGTLAAATQQMENGRWWCHLERNGAFCDFTFHLIIWGNCSWCNTRRPFIVRSD